MSFSGVRLSPCSPAAWRDRRPSCTLPRAYARVLVAAKSSNTAAGSSNSATTRMNHLRTVWLSAPSMVGAA
jgi:hypothetical protein